jgi:hypothetical protein
VTVKVGVVAVAVAPDAVLAIIAAARFSANVVVLVLTAYVPARVGAVPVQQVFVPLLPAVVVPHA